MMKRLTALFCSPAMMAGMSTAMIGHAALEGFALGADGVVYSLEMADWLNENGIEILNSDRVSEELVVDVNGDGSIDASDAAVILQYSARAGSGNFAGTLEAYVESIRG